MYNIHNLYKEQVAYPIQITRTHYINNILQGIITGQHALFKLQEHIIGQHALFKLQDHIT